MSGAERPSDVELGGDELLRIVLESVTDFAIFTMDRHGLVTSWNIGAERLLGYARDEILGREGDIIFTPSDRAQGAPEQERASALADGRAEDERWHMRKDGSQFWSSGLLMPLRQREGFAKILRDRTANHLAEVQVSQREAWFRVLATTIPQLVFRSLRSGERVWVSPQWEDYTGLSQEQSRGFGWLESIHPDDREAARAAWARAPEAGLYDVEYRIRRAADGRYRWHQARAAPVDGKRHGTGEWVGACADIDDLRSMHEHQKVLVAELQHRTRNLLALVQAVSRQTLRTADSLEGYEAQFEERLRALGRVQGLLARSEHMAVDVRALIETELLAHGAHEGERVTIEGPAAGLSPGAAQTLSLAIHELATNAVKYGALGHAGARLSVRWRKEEGARPERLLLEWLESGVAILEPPARRGYGSELILMALPYQLGAETSLDFAPDGVRCRLSVPLASPREEEAR